MPIDSSKAVGEIAAQQPGSAAVFERMGIDYCCGGKQSLSDACSRAGVSFEEVARELAEAEAATPAPAEQPDGSQSLGAIIDVIVTRHHAYVREQIPRLQSLAKKTIEHHAGNHPELQNIEVLFADLAADLMVHMLKEERVLFPYIRLLEAAKKAGKVAPPAFFGTVQRPIHAMITEHDAAGDLTRSIRDISRDFALPADACATYRALFSGLEEFECDLHRHVHLENNVLFPRAIELEKQDAGSPR